MGWLSILTVDVVRNLEQLTDADALADGFQSAADMRKMLKQLYPNSRGDGRQWFRVEFQPEAATATTATATRAGGPLFVE